MAERQSLVLTLLGPDQPGMVESVADTVLAHGGNWIESRMARLGGQFAGIVRVEVDHRSAPDLRSALERLDLNITVAGTEAGDSESAGLELEVLGQDRPGIVREITHALSSRSINLIEFESHCQSAPWSGEPLFRAKARLALPEGQSVDRIRDDLEVIANQLTLEIDLVERRSVS